PRDAERPDVTGTVVQRLDRRGEEAALTALLVTGRDLEDPGIRGPRFVLRALGGRPAADRERRDRGRTLAQGGADAVRARVPASDDDDVLPGGIDVSRVRLDAGLAPVLRDEVVHRRMHA